MTIKKRQEAEITFLEIEGRIDTNTSPQLQAELLKVFQGASYVTLDFAKVQYVSSAGLRALLIGQKTATSKKAKLELINVPTVVMTVLDSVGFSKVLTIRK